MDDLQLLQDERELKEFLELHKNEFGIEVAEVRRIELPVIIMNKDNIRIFPWSFFERNMDNNKIIFYEDECFAKITYKDKPLGHFRIFSDGAVVLKTEYDLTNSRSSNIGPKQLKEIYEMIFTFIKLVKVTMKYLHEENNKITNDIFHPRG